jgi:hypothetical protein
MGDTIGTFPRVVDIFTAADLDAVFPDAFDRGATFHASLTFGNHFRRSPPRCQQKKEQKPPQDHFFNKECISAINMEIRIVFRCPYSSPCAATKKATMNSFTVALKIVRISVLFSVVRISVFRPVHRTETLPNYKPHALPFRTINHTPYRSEL